MTTNGLSTSTAVEDGRIFGASLTLSQRTNTSTCSYNPRSDGLRYGASLMRKELFGIQRAPIILTPFIQSSVVFSRGELPTTVAGSSGSRRGHSKNGPRFTMRIAVLSLTHTK